MKKGLALFDFDGTITSRDSLLEFIKFASGKLRFFLVMGLFSPFIFYYVFVKKEGEVAKMKVLSFLYKGKSRAELELLGASFARKVIPNILLPNAIDEINRHKNENNRIVVVSASLNIWLKPWAESMNIELLCTQMKFENEIFTGQFGSPNCVGLEKVTRIKAHLNLKDYSPIYAYGNSKGDLQMLELADHKFFRKFD